VSLALTVSDTRTKRGAPPDPPGGGNPLP
jgi:hypothetical protein